MNGLAPNQPNVSLETLRVTLPAFEARLSEFLIEMGLNPGSLPVIDHAAVRLATSQQTDRLVREIAPISENGTWFSRNEIHGRDICIFRLQDPLTILGQEVYFLEVPYPKVGREYARVGWEHIEFTLRPSTITNAALHQLSEEQALATYRREFDVAFPTFSLPPDVTHSADSRRAAGEDFLNLLLNFEKSPDLIVRFHPRTIEEVVENRC
jgi:predicted metalloenzyme YecM